MKESDCVSCATVQYIVLEIGTARPVSLISKKTAKIFLAPLRGARESGLNFQNQSISKVPQQCLNFQELISKAIYSTVRSLYLG